MEYYHYLYGKLYQKGFRNADESSEVFWYMEEEQCLNLLHIVREPLPGQDIISVQELEAIRSEVSRSLMITRGKKVIWQSVCFFKSTPSQEVLSSLAQLPFVWTVIRETGQLLIYEEQRSEFCQVEELIETSLKEFVRDDKAQKKSALQRVFTPMNTILIGINVLVFLILSALGDPRNSGFMINHGALYLTSIMDGKEYYRLFTAFFLHFDWEHLIGNMFVLFVTGSLLERVIGKARYMIVYLVSGLLASVCSVVFTLQNGAPAVTAGASGAVFGVMGGILGCVIKELWGKKPQSLKEYGLTGVFFMVVVALSYGYSQVGIDNAAHLGGVVTGFLLTLIFC